MRGGADDDEAQEEEEDTRRAPASVQNKEEEEEEEEDEVEEGENGAHSATRAGVVSTHQGLNSPRDTIVLDASYPPPPDDLPDEEEEDEDDALEVVVETLTGDIFRVRVSQWDTAASLKRLLSRTQGIPMKDQHLLFGETELMDDLCLIEQNVVNGSTLKLVLKMRGGPINPRRMPAHQQDFLQEFSNIVDQELDQGRVWDSNGGRTVTLLVVREGENVNVYRVVENNDGSFSPLNESFDSRGNGEDPERDTLQEAEDDARTRARMKELQERLRKRNKKNKSKKLFNSQRSDSRASKGAPERLEDTKTAPITPTNKTATITNNPAEDAAVPAAEVSKSPGKTGETGSRPSSSNQRLVKSASRRGSRLNQQQHWGGRNSRPTTQERSEMRRNSLSKNSVILDVLPTHKASKPVNFTRREPLEDIPAKTERNRLSAVDEELVKDRGSLKHPGALSKSQRNKKNFESYRKSIVKHVMPSGSSMDGHGNDDSDNEGVDDAREAWPRREGTVPFYMPPIGPITRRNYEGDRLNQSHNHDLLRMPRVKPTIRPKTSPEVLEHRPGSTSGQSTISSDRVHLKAPDDPQLREICTILSNSRANSRQSHRSLDSPPDTLCPPSLSTSFSSSTGLPRTHRNNSVSVSLSSLKGHGGTPPSPGRGALVTSGSRKQRDMLREFMKNQSSSSRRNTPENMRRRPNSGRLHASSPHLPPVTPPRRRTKKKPRCDQCSKRVRLATTYDCSRCGRIFCTQHRLPETHGCNFDFRTEGRRLIEMANPLVAPHRLPKI